MRTINLKDSMPTVDEARRRLVREIDNARAGKVRLLKIIHGWGSTGQGGALAPAIRRSLGLRRKEGKVACFVPGERFCDATREGSLLARKFQQVRGDSDFNRANPGITIVELAP